MTFWRVKVALCTDHIIDEHKMYIVISVKMACHIDCLMDGGY